MHRFLQSKIVVGLMAALVLWMGFAVFNIRAERKRTEEQVANVQAKLEQLKNDNNHLSRVVTYLRNPQYLARLAREKLNYKTTDEEVVYVYPEEKKATASVGELKVDALGTLEKVKKWWYSLVRNDE